MPPDLAVLARRQQNAEARRRQRAAKAEEEAKAATSPNPSGYVVPRMPGRMSELRRWYRAQHDAYSQRVLGPLELAEVRRSFNTMMDSYKAGAFLRQSHAAMRAAEAQERMAALLAQVESGGAAWLMLSRLQEGLQDGRGRRPLPGRPMTALPSSPKGEPA